MREIETEYRMINSGLILSDESYQRKVDVNRVKNICSHFNPNLVNPVKVSYRNGNYYVFDGQHTLASLVMRNNDKDLPVSCKVYYNMTKEEEAKLFSEQNGLSRFVETNAKFKALYTAGDIDIIELKRTIESVGIECDFSKSAGKTSGKRLICYKSAYDIYIKDGSQFLQEVLRVIIAAWNGEGLSLNKEIVIGLAMFMRTYKNQYDINKLITRLSKVSPTQIIRDGKAITVGGNKRYARMILQIYNKNTSNARLDDRF